MIHIRKLLFYLFLLVALSAASVVSVLKLSDNGIPTGNDYRPDVKKIADSVAETTVDPLIDPNVRLSVEPSSTTVEGEIDSESDAIGMEAFGDQILAAEKFADENTADEVAPVDLEDETNSDFDFIAVSAVRTAEDEENEEIVFEDNEVADETVFEDVVDDVASDAVESSQDVSYSEGFDGDDDWVVFDENDETDEDVEDSIDFVFDEVSDEVSDDETELDTDSNADSDTEDVVNMNETFVVDMNADDEIVFDSNDFPLEDKDELEDASSDEISFDDDDLVEEEADSTIASSADVSFDDVFESDETSADVAETDVETTDVLDEDVVAEETNDSIDDFLSALESNDVEDEIVFDDNDVDNEEVVDDVESAPLDEEITEVESDSVGENSDANAQTTAPVDDESENGDSESNAGKVFFKTKSAKDAAIVLPNIDALEQEAEFFKGTLQAKDDEEENASGRLLETGKTDDAYTSEIVYDSNDASESDDETPDASDDSTTCAPADEADDASDGDEQEKSNEPADPCGPVVLCLVSDDEETEEADAVAEKVESQSLEQNNKYHQAPTTVRVSSQSVADKVPATPTNHLQDEIWIISQGGTYWLFENGSWNQKEPKSFFSGDDPRRVSIIWAHGYQTDMSSASRSGFNLKAVVDAARAATGVDRKYRLVIWKWESERNNTRLRLDAREKKDLAYYSGTKLGNFVGRLNPKDDVVFIGFSFGALVTGSALQTLATTSNRYMSGRNKTAFATSGVETETTSEVASGRISILLVSAACDLGSFNQGGIFQTGATLPTRALNVYNPTDYALKFYPLISGTSQAIGIAPLMGNEFVNAVGETFNVNANSYLGKEHSFDEAIECVPSTTLSDMIF